MSVACRLVKPATVVVVNRCIYKNTSPAKLTDKSLCLSNQGRSYAAPPPRRMNDKSMNLTEPVPRFKEHRAEPYSLTRYNSNVNARIIYVGCKDLDA